MSRTNLRGRAFVEGEILGDVSVVVDSDGGLIDEVRVHRAATESDQKELIVPAFIDVHVHGGAGSDFMDGSPEAIEAILRHHMRDGTAAVMATTLSASRERLRKTVEAISEHAVDPDIAEIVGIHLEGPWISAESAGAQDQASIRAPDVLELKGLLALAPDLRWMVTLAPEIAGARNLIESFRHQVVFSIGHTHASFGEAAEALDLGASHFTHLFNAMTPLHHREPGVVGAALTSADATAELIADGIHVHPVVLALATRLMAGRLALVTDAMRASGMPEGVYDLYDYRVTVRDGAARLDDGTLAGSTLTMRQAVCNMVELAGVPLEIVLPMATETPARIAGVGDRKGRIREGHEADLLVLSEKFEIRRMILHGKELELA
ncbi:MAG TPA: N-acetylglucosamine-6-phosphate deacetylase [Thermoanaerobaculia bacterium]|nr:N-acetylglucosamine-6-phosphate deacetylase [Thermoanaerobaculia bacterium]